MSGYPTYIEQQKDVQGIVSLHPFPFSIIVTVIVVPLASIGGVEQIVHIARHGTPPSLWSTVHEPPSKPWLAKGESILRRANTVWWDVAAGGGRR